MPTVAGAASLICWLEFSQHDTTQSHLRTSAEKYLLPIGLEASVEGIFLISD